MRVRLSKKGIAGVIIFALALILGPLRSVVINLPIIGTPMASVYYWTAKLRFWETQPKSPYAALILIPQINGNPVTDSPVGPHFKSQTSAFVLTAKPTAIYATPSTNAKVLQSVKSGIRVRVVYIDETNQIQTAEGRGQWAFVTSESGDTPLGWIPSPYLGFQDQFTPSESVTHTGAGLCIGEYCGEIQFKPNGRFIETWDSVGKGIHLRGTNTGQIWVYKDIVWIKQDHRDDYDELLIITPDGLRQEEKYKSEPFRNGRSPGKSIRAQGQRLF